MILITGFFRPVIADNPPVQRALLIGIDKYIQPGKEGRWQNLDGCVNDIVSIKEVLQARFGFAEKNMNLMMNQEASRANILGGFSKLLQESSAGDIAVIYYAGHGSQVKNSASAETDKRDESLVPSDSYTGARDIRDKELAAIFNEFATRKILLTVIFDCCHSGSMGRGPLSNDSPKMRFILPDESFDAKDASNPDPPENNGVLIMSASQDYEFACEQKDENGTAHGAFSIALIQTLTSLPAGSPATDIFASVRAILKYNGKKQEPVLAGTEKRKTQTLFGIDKTALSGKTRVAVIEAGEKGIILQGGYALGIYPDCELSKNNSHGQAICLIVKEIINLNSCVAKVISGNRDDIKPGDLFELKSWCLPENSILKVFIPQSDLEYEQLKSILLIQKQLMDNKYYSMIDDPARTSPTHTVFYEQGNWYIGMPEGKTISLGSEINSEKISRNIPEDSKVYFSIPPTKELRLALTDSYKYSTAVEPVSKSSDAQYFLTGRLVNGS
ncbi:MAG: caspase family protein, partial [Bacteroidia bacterium]|nr:caspase family protein [Bacteroidia bacterium]